MNRRGVTLVETLAALFLIATIAITIVAWTTGLQRDAVSLADQLRWQLSAERALDVIADASLDGVLYDPSVRAKVRGQASRARIEPDGRLLITAIAWHADSVVSFRFDEGNERLLLDTANTDESRVLIGALVNAEFQLIQTLNNATLPNQLPETVLLVRLQSKTGQVAARSWEVKP